MKYLPIEEVVSNAMLSLGCEDSRDKIIFRQWAYIAMRQIGCSYLDIEIACPEVCDLSFRKPTNLISTIEVSLADVSGRSINYKYIHNRGLLPMDEATSLSLGYGMIMLSEDDDFYHLSSNATCITAAEIKYYSLPVDENGDPKVPERDLLTVMSFIEFMYIKRKRIMSPNLVSGGDLTLFRDLWQRELMKAKGRNKMPSIHQAREIARGWMSMINKAIFKN